MLCAALFYSTCDGGTVTVVDCVIYFPAIRTAQFYFYLDSTVVYEIYLDEYPTIAPLNGSYVFNALSYITLLWDYTGDNITISEATVMIESGDASSPFNMILSYQTCYNYPNWSNITLIGSE